MDGVGGDQHIHWLVMLVHWHIGQQLCAVRQCNCKGAPKNAKNVSASAMFEKVAQVAGVSTPRRQEAFLAHASARGCISTEGQISSKAEAEVGHTRQQLPSLTHL